MMMTMTYSPQSIVSAVHSPALACSYNVMPKLIFKSCTSLNLTPLFLSHSPLIMIVMIVRKIIIRDVYLV